MDIVKDTVLACGKVLDLVSREYRKDGVVRKWEMATRKGGKRSVIVVPRIWTDYYEKLVVTKEYRVPLGDYEYGFPAGMIDEGETPEQAATRELKEETGYTVLHIDRVSPFVFNSAGMTDESSSIVFVRVSDKRGEQNLQSSEEIEALELNRDEVSKLLCSNAKIGSKEWLILDYFSRFGAI